MRLSPGWPSVHMAGNQTVCKAVIIFSYDYADMACLWNLRAQLSGGVLALLAQFLDSFRTADFDSSNHSYDIHHRKFRKRILSEKERCILFYRLELTIVNSLLLVLRDFFFAQIMISWQRPCRGKASAPTPRPHLAPTGVNHAGHSLLADLAVRLFWRHLCLLSPSTSLLHHILSASRNVSVWRDSKLYL